MYYIRWRDKQSGPYESHQILQLAEQGLVTDWHEVIDSVTLHSMTLKSFRAQMQDGPLNTIAVEDVRHHQQVQIQQLQAQQDEIKHLREENERIARQMKELARERTAPRPPPIQVVPPQVHIHQYTYTTHAAAASAPVEPPRPVEVPSIILPFAHQPVVEPEPASLPASVQVMPRSVKVPALPKVNPSILPSTAYMVSKPKREVRRLRRPADDPRPRSRGFYILLAVLLGTLGIHNFYAGRYAIGLIQLFVTTFLGFFIVPWFLVFSMTIAEIFFIERDGDGVRMT